MRVIHRRVTLERYRTLRRLRSSIEKLVMVSLLYWWRSLVKIRLLLPLYRPMGPQCLTILLLLHLQLELLFTDLFLKLPYAHFILLEFTHRVRRLHLNRIKCLLTWIILMHILILKWCESHGTTTIETHLHSLMRLLWCWIIISYKVWTNHSASSWILMPLLHHYFLTLHRLMGSLPWNTRKMAWWLLLAKNKHASLAWFSLATASRCRKMCEVLKLSLQLLNLTLAINYYLSLIRLRLLVFTGISRSLIFLWQSILLRRFWSIGVPCIWMVRTGISLLVFISLILNFNWSALWFLLQLLALVGFGSAATRNDLPMLGSDIDNLRVLGSYGALVMRIWRVVNVVIADPVIINAAMIILAVIWSTRWVIWSLFIKVFNAFLAIIRPIAIKTL